MQIEYERQTFGGKIANEKDSIAEWIESNLRHEGIESQIYKLQRLLSIVGEQWLISNPDRVDEVANAVECSGRYHKLTNNES